MEGMDVLVRYGRTRAHDGLRKKLATEDPVEPAGSGRFNKEAVVATREQLHCSQKVCERRIDRHPKVVHASIIV